MQQAGEQATARDNVKIQTIHGNPKNHVKPLVLRCNMKHNA